MVSEKINFNFDITKLILHVEKCVRDFEPVMVGSFFGGWSVYSSNGSYQDGWARGEKIYKDDFMPGASREEKMLALGIKKSHEYIQETEICTGYLKEVMDYIKNINLEPRRARLSLLKAGGQSSLHQDAPANQYAIRLHVPIITNTGCTFACNAGEEHFADGNAYFIYVNRLHQVFNRGVTDRIHLIMDVTDSNNITKHHRKPI